MIWRHFQICTKLDYNLAMNTQAQDITIEEFDQSSILMKEQFLAQLDTTFTTDMIFEVEKDPHSFRLVPKILEIPITKKYKIEFEDGEQIWDRIIVAQEKGDICGFLAYAYQDWNKRLSVWHFYVGPEQRKKGIGTLLMERLLQIAKNCRAKTVWIETSNVNYPAIQMYQKLGFSICGLDTSLYAGTQCADEQAIFLLLDLNENYS